MAKRASSDLKTDRPTYAADFLQTDVDKVMFFDHPMIDNLVTTVLALGAEIWASQRRTMVLERVLEEKGITQEMVEGYMPTEEDVADWQAARDRFVERTMGPLKRDSSLPPSTDWQDED